MQRIPGNTPYRDVTEEETKERVETTGNNPIQVDLQPPDNAHEFPAARYGTHDAPYREWHPHGEDIYPRLRQPSALDDNPPQAKISAVPSLQDIAVSQTIIKNGALHPRNEDDCLANCDIL